MARIFLSSVLSCFFLLVLGAPALAQSEYTAFREAFDKAAALGSKSKMDSLMKGEQKTAIYWVEITAEQIAQAPNDILYARFEALSSSWSRVYETKFPQKREQFFAYLDTTTKRARFKLKNKYDKVQRSQANATSEKNTGKLELVAGELEVLAQGFQDMGDKYMESQCRLSIAAALEETLWGKRADLNRVANAYARFIFLREELGLKDLPYRQGLPRYQGLKALGYGSEGAATGAPEGTGGGAAVSSGPKSAGPAVSAKLSFKETNPLKDTNRPNYYLDEHRQIWPAVDLKAVGSTTKIPRLEDGPTVVRESSSKALIDADGDGKGDVQWPVKGKLERVTVSLGTGASKREWSVMTETGRQQDFYQGVQMNLQMTDDSMRLFMVAAGAMVGDVSGTPVEIFDDNMDGVYGSPVSKWKHFGIHESTEQPEFDSIRVGKSKKAGPWSEYVNFGKAGWHRLESKNGGTELSAQPVEFKTGTLQLKTKGLKPNCLIVKGLGPELENTYVDISGGKKVELPIGRYELVFGIVRKGSKMQQMKAVILPTQATRVWDVVEGENVEVAMGAPYTFDFDYAVSGDTVTVTGNSVRVIGSGGEAYDRIYGAVAMPEAGVRKKGSKRASATARMVPVADNDGLAKHGWGSMWVPLSADLPKKGSEVEVQLTEKKNKLFGAIASIWK